MRILGLEFSSEQRSVAVVEYRTGLPPVPLGESAEFGARSLKALSLVEAALRQAGLEREQIDGIAIGLGPGSYTGIRAAISLAQGWHLARGVKLLGLSSVECLAAQAQAEGMFGRVNMVIDAQRNEFYLAVYEVQKNSRRVVEPLRLGTLAEVKSRWSAGESLVGPDLGRWFSSGKTLFPQAAMLAKLAAERTDFVSGETLEPIYLRQTSFVKAPLPRTIT